MSIQVKLSFTHNDMPIMIELDAKSLSALDNLKWIVDKVATWIDEKTHLEERSERE
ncbi:MAG: hypothetical protein QXT26_08225 [Thermoproteota archaeon]